MTHFEYISIAVALILSLVVSRLLAGVSAARRLGARTGRLIAYANSGDASGDYERVVGYAGMVLA